MATLQVRDLDDELYETLKRYAKREHRSISQQAAYILEQFLTGNMQTAADANAAFLMLAGTWHDERPAREIAEDLRASRKQGRRQQHLGDVFD